jgi:hypothetical protein
MNAASSAKPTAISRRRAMQWVMAAVAASALPAAVPSVSFGQPKPTAPQEEAAKQPGPPGARGYGTDPNLVNIYLPGDLWPLTLTDAQKKTAKAVADVILPKDQYGPAASEVGVIEMVDEWVSAPYPEQEADRPMILEGLAWIDAESTRRFTKPFADLDDAQKHAICDDICYHAGAKPEFKKGSSFFSRFRKLCASAYYATPEGWTAIGYVGNVPLAAFDGPPKEVLERLGVTQTVK